MAYRLNNISDAIDGKFLITKSIANQAGIGTLVHIMDARQNSSGTISVNYRITSTGQDYSVEFSQMQDFCKWAYPDQFIARNYAKFDRDDIIKYIKSQNKTFLTGCLPFIIISVIAIWVLCGIMLDGILFPVISIVASTAASVLLVWLYKKSKSSVMMYMYKKLSSSWGIDF